MRSWLTKNGCQIYQLISGRCNTYLISDGKKSLLVDPGMEKNRIKLIQRAEALGVQADTLSGIVLTHVHYDHAESTAALKEYYKVPVFVHKTEADILAQGDNPVIRGTLFITRCYTRPFEKMFREWVRYTPCCCDVSVEEEYDLAPYGFKARILHTPGHTAGSVSIIVDDEIALVGDTLFGIVKGSVFPPFGQDTKLMIKSWAKLLDTGCLTFLPGHGGARSRSLLQKGLNRHLQST